MAFSARSSAKWGGPVADRWAPGARARRPEVCAHTPGVCAAVVVFLASVWVALAAADVPLSPQAAASMERKWLVIQQFGAVRWPGVRETPVSESELNSYLRLVAVNEWPTGVVDPYVKLMAEQNVECRAVVDLDRVRTAQPRGWLDPMNLLTGRVPVVATGRFTARNGQARFVLDYATVAGVPVPKLVLAELLAFYTRSTETPQGVGLDDPYPLPARMKEVHVGAGNAVVIQR